MKKTFLLILAIMAYVTTFGSTPDYRPSGSWNGDYVVPYSSPQRTVNLLTGDITVSMTGDISLKRSVFVGKLGGDVQCNLVIENNSGTPLHIWNDLDGYPVGSPRDPYMVMFSVGEGSSLTIRGVNAPVIIHGNMNHAKTQTYNDGSARDVKIKGGFIESTGNMTLDNVIIEEVLFDEETSRSGNASAIKLHPWYDLSSLNQFLMGKTTLKNVEIRNIEMPGGAGGAINCYLKTQTLSENTRENCTITLDGVKIHNVNQTGMGALTYLNESTGGYEEKSDGNGGIVRFRGDWVGNLVMKNCEIYDNTSVYSCAGVYWNSMGRINEPCELTIDGCTFRNNKVTGADQNAGALMVEGRCRFIGNPTTFEGNSCQRFGGAIFIHNYNSVDAVEEKFFDYSINEKVILKNNKAKDGGGACIFIDSNSTLSTDTKFALSVDGATFEGNEVTHEGGGLKIDYGAYTYGLTVNLNSGTFTNNRVIGTNGDGDGGAIYCYRADINYTKDTSLISFNGNSASRSGGAIYANSCPNFILSNVLFDGNTSNKQGGGICAISSNLKFNSGTIKNNKTLTRDKTDYSSSDDYDKTENSEGGGGIFLMNSTFEMPNGEIINNETQSDGGGVYALSSTFKLGNGKINGNRSLNGSCAQHEGGGGVYLKWSSFVMEKGEINDNESASNGGGVYFYNSANTETREFTFNGGSISNNKSKGHGGGVCILTGSRSTAETCYTLKGGDISYNEAEDGGGVYYNGWTINTLNLKDTHIQSNIAKTGGGLLVYCGKMNYENGLIRHNKAISRPGVDAPKTVYWQNHCGAADVYRNEIHGVGGGMYLSVLGQVDFTGTTFGIYGNTADNGGDDIIAVGDRTKIVLPDVTKMSLTDFDSMVPQSSLFWAQDYIKGDESYYNSPNATYSASEIDRYRTKQNNYLEIAELTPGTYGPGDNKGTGTNYISAALGYEYVFVELIKKGLLPRESAIIDIYKGRYSDVSGQQPFMQVLLSGEQGAEEVSRIVALYAGDWTIVENSWSWTYSSANRNIIRTLSKNSSSEDKRFVFTSEKMKKSPNAENFKVNDEMKK